MTYTNEEEDRTEDRIQECPNCGEINKAGAEFCSQCGQALNLQSDERLENKKEKKEKGIEVAVDGRALVGGVMGGLIFTVPNVAPLIYSGLQTASIASNAALFQVAGVSVLLATALLSLKRGEGGVPKRSIYSALSAFLLIALVGYAAVPVGAAINDSGGDAGLSGEDLRVATLEVEGMVCDGCRLTVKNYLESMDGTEKVTVSLPKKQATVVYDSTRVSAQGLVDSDVFQGAYSATLKDDRSYEG